MAQRSKQFAFLARCSLLAHGGQQRLRQRGDEDSLREFKQPLAIVQIRNTPLLQKRCKQTGHHHVDLIDSHPNYPWKHQKCNAFHRRMVDAPHRTESKIVAFQQRQRDQKLQDPAHHYTPSKSLNGNGIKGAKKQRTADYAQIEKYRRKRWDKEVAIDIENAGDKGEQAYEKYIGKHGAGQINSEQHFPRNRPKAMPHYIDYPRRAQNT